MKVSILIFALLCMMLMGTCAMADWGIQIWPDLVNTTSLVSPFVTDGGDDIDNLWGYNAWLFHGNPWISNSDPKYREDAPVITTTIAGLDPTRTYDIRALFFDRTLSDNLPGVIMAGLHGESLIKLDRNNSILEATYEADIQLFAHYVGTVSGVSSASVDIDDPADNSGRAYYAFLQYRDVTPVPEPSALAAMATGFVGILGFAVRRRK